ncbi:cobalt ECF transporter T component CbiQ [Lacrimispora sp. JR3]|uniref:cobalt ECF transporter T component CbiQ n=1 Tax=Lacrimispora sinapis TaxID=3111456 RepID=UPI003749F0CA
MKTIHTIDYYAYVSGMKGWNSQFKAIVAVAALFFCIGADKVWVSMLVFLPMSFLTVFVGRVSWRSYLALLRIPLAFLLMGTAAIAVGLSPVPYGNVSVSVFGYYLYLTEDGLRMAVRLILKAMAALSAMYMLVLSTPASEIICIFGRLHVPKIILELMNMIYRFIFVMMDTQYRMRLAAESRLGFLGFRTACRSFGSLAGNLFVVSLKKAGVYYDALTARCYDGELMFLEEEKRLKGWQIWAAVSYFLILFLGYLLSI